ncbi:hypothetical protein ACFL09_01960, partial [Planctomycetota bacterium]
MRRVALVPVICAVVVLGLWCPAAQAEVYAVVLATTPDLDEPDTWFHEPACQFADALIDQLNWLPENVVLLSGDGTHPWNGSSVPKGTKANLQAAIDSLAPLGPRDTFLLWSFGHGGGDADAPEMHWEEYLDTHGVNTSAEKLAQMCSAITAGQEAYMFGSCYSGGMLYAMEQINGVGTQPGAFGCASANHYEVSWSNPVLTPTDFLDAARVAIDSGLTETHDIYQSAYTNTWTAIDGEGPGGTWVDPGELELICVQHPWKSGDNFDLAVAEWQGDLSDQWEIAANWRNGLLPEADRFVRITCDPNPAVMRGQFAEARVLRVMPGSTLELIPQGPTESRLNVTCDADNEGGTINIYGSILDVGGDLVNTGGTITVLTGNVGVGGDVVNADAQSQLYFGNGAVVSASDAHNAGTMYLAGVMSVHDFTNTGAVEVDGVGILNVGHDLYQTGPTSTLTLQAGLSTVQVGNNFEANGYTNAGPGTAILVANTLYAGYGGDDVTTVINLDQATLEADRVLFGVDRPAFVASARSTIDVAGLLAVGAEDQGTLQLYGGEVQTTELLIGDGTYADGHLLMSASHGTPPEVKLRGTLTQDPIMVVGYDGYGQVVQGAGTVGPLDPVRDELTIVLGYSGKGEGTWLLNHGEVRAHELHVGVLGVGAFNQQGGLVALDHELRLATGPGSEATYTIREGAVDVPALRLGQRGTATLTQEGGLVQISGELEFGAHTTGDATYNLNGGVLKVHEITHGLGQGTLNIDGGILDLTGPSIAVQTLNIGTDVGGELNLVGKTLTVDVMRVGHGADGTFNMTGGTAIVDGELTVAVTAGTSGSLNQTGGDLTAAEVRLGQGGPTTGTYLLDNGSLSISGSLLFGTYGSGVFTQRGTSTVTVDTVTMGHHNASDGNLYRMEAGEMSVATLLELGSNAGSTGNEFLLLGGKVSAGEVIVGNGGEGTFLHYGPLLEVAGTLTLGKKATGAGYYVLDGDELKTAETIVGGAGAGAFSHVSGTHAINGDLYVAQGGAASSYDMMASAATLTAHNEYIGYEAVGAFTQNAGENLVEESLHLGCNPGGYGEYALNGGTLWVGEHIYVGHNGGTGILYENGGKIEGATNTLFIAPGSTMSGWGTVDMTVENNGVLQADSPPLAELTLKRPYSGAGSIV